MRELGSSPEQIGNAAKLVNRIAAKFLRPGLCAVLAYEFVRALREGLQRRPPAIESLLQDGHLPQPGAVMSASRTLGEIRGMLEGGTCRRKPE